MAHDKFIMAHDKFIMAHDEFVMAHDKFIMAHDKFIMAHDKSPLQVPGVPPPSPRGGGGQKYLLALCIDLLYKCQNGSGVKF